MWETADDRSQFEHDKQECNTNTEYQNWRGGGRWWRLEREFEKLNNN